MATRKNMRKNSRKNMRKSSRKSTRKAQTGGRSAWLQKVMRVYKEMKAKNPNTKLGEAMKAAKKIH